MQEVTVSFGRSSNLAEITNVKKLPWQEFISLLAAPIEGEDKAAPGWYIPAEFSPVYRDSDNFVARYALTLDYDRIEQFDVEDIFESFASYTYFAYTTFSHTLEKPRLRIVVPLARTVLYGEYQAISRKVAAVAGIELAARESHAPAQMMFLPVRKVGAEFLTWSNSGKWLDPDTVLASYANWQDRTEWPHCKNGDAVYSFEGELTPPTEKPGWIGAFCRVFDIPAAIEKFELPYKSTANGDRWTYVGGTRPEGAVVYDSGQKIHSHHDSDPARGQTHSWDLVRLHRFADLDDGVKPDTKITDRPSHKAMLEFARSLPEIQEEIKLDAATEFADVPRPTAAEKAVTVAKIEAEGRFHVKSYSEVKDLPPLRWIIKRVLPEAELVVLYGAPGAGKSFGALDMAAAVTRGVPWRSFKTNPGLAVVVAAEGARGFLQRMQAYQRHFEVSPDGMPGVITDAPNLKQAADAAEISRRVVDWAAGRKVSLIFIDTLSASAAGSNENSGEDMGQVIAHCKFINRKTGATVVVVHHSGKDESRGARGWSGWKGAVDAEIEITRNGDMRTISVTKMKDGTDGMQFGFKLKTIPLGVDEDGDLITSCVVEHTDVVAPRVKLADPQNKEYKAILIKVREYLRDGKEATEYAVAAEIAKQLPDAGDKNKTQNKILKALQTLTNLGYIYYNDRMMRTVESAPVSSERWDQ